MTESYFSRTFLALEVGAAGNEKWSGEFVGVLDKLIGDEP